MYVCLCVILLFTGVPLLRKINVQYIAMKFVYKDNSLEAQLHTSACGLYTYGCGWFFKYVCYSATYVAYSIWTSLHAVGCVKYIGGPCIQVALYYV